MAITLSPDVKIAKTPELPTFKSVEEERFTARDPEFPDHFWVNPFGMHYSHMGYQICFWSTKVARWCKATTP